MTVPIAVLAVLLNLSLSWWTECVIFLLTVSLVIVLFIQARQLDRARLQPAAGRPHRQVDQCPGRRAAASRVSDPRRRCLSPGMRTFIPADRVLNTLPDACSDLGVYFAYICAGVSGTEARQMAGIEPPSQPIPFLLPPSKLCRSGGNTTKRRYAMSLQSRSGGRRRNAHLRITTDRSVASRDGRGGGRAGSVMAPTGTSFASASGHGSIVKSGHCSVITLRMRPASNWSIDRPSAVDRDPAHDVSARRPGVQAPATECPRRRVRTA